MTDFNLFTFNSRVWPGTDPLVVKHGERVRVRLANLSMDNHPIHFHGHHFVDHRHRRRPHSRHPPGFRRPPSTCRPGTTRDVEFVADNPGDWAFHCHKTHHTMNAMSHDVPNMIGVNQDEVAAKIEQSLPGYMAMGSNGMGEMADMQMPLPKNTLPMMSGNGPFGPIEMGGCSRCSKVATTSQAMKIRDRISSRRDRGCGW